MSDASWPPRFADLPGNASQRDSRAAPPTPMYIRNSHDAYIVNVAPAGGETAFLYDDTPGPLGAPFIKTQYSGIVPRNLLGLDGPWTSGPACLATRWQTPFNHLWAPPPPQTDVDPAFSVFYPASSTSSACTPI